MTKQHFDVSQSYYQNRFQVRHSRCNGASLITRSSEQPYLAYWGVFWSVVFIVISGFKVFFKFDVSVFFTACMHQRASCRCRWFGPLTSASAPVQTPTSSPLSVSTWVTRSSSERKCGSQKKWISSPYAGRLRVCRCNIYSHHFHVLQGIPSVEDTEVPEDPPKSMLQKMGAVLF